MSKALKCDRCGAYYGFYTNVEHKIKRSAKIQAQGISIEKMDSDREIINSTTLDLCPNCMKKLIDWLEVSFDPQENAPTYNDIFKEFLTTIWRASADTILDWRPAEDVCTIRVWTKAGPIYIYDYATKRVTLEVHHDASDTFV